MLKKFNSVNLFTTWTEILSRLSESFMDSGLILKIMSLFIRAQFRLHNFTPGQQAFYWGSLRPKLLCSKYSPGLCSAFRCPKKQSNRGNKETLWLKKRWFERKGNSLGQKRSGCWLGSDALSGSYCTNQFTSANRMICLTSSETPDS